MGYIKDVGYFSRGTTADMMERSQQRQNNLLVEQTLSAKSWAKINLCNTIKIEALRNFDGETSCT